LEKGPRIRDEIILQLVKQIRGNTNKFSAEAAWATLASVTSIASPSDNFSYPLMHWLIDIIDLHENKSYKEWGRFILARLYNNLSAQDKRVFVPESNEISYIINKRQIKAPLFMPNGAFMTMFIESYTDFETMKKTALYRMGLHTDHVWRYGIMEVVEYDNKYGRPSVTQRKDSSKIISTS
jgi:MyTH4 domain